MKGKFYESIDEVIKNCTLYELAIADKLKENRQKILEAYKGKRSGKLEDDDPYLGFKVGWLIEDYTSFSMERNQDEDAIRRRCIINKVFKNDMICLDYICRFTQLSFDFIKELCFINSPFFKFEYYTRENIEFYTKFLNSKEDNRRKIIKSWSKDKSLIPNVNSVDMNLINDMIERITSGKRNIIFTQINICTLLDNQNCGDKILEAFDKYIDSITTRKMDEDIEYKRSSRFITTINEIKAFGCSRWAPVYKQRKVITMKDPEKRAFAIKLLKPEYFNFTELKNKRKE